MCKILYVSVSGYYKYKKLLGKPGKDDILSAAMDAILKESPFNDNYGAPRMQIALLQKGIKAGIRRITRIMREHGWLHKPHRKPKPRAMDVSGSKVRDASLRQSFSRASRRSPYLAPSAG